MLLEDLIAYPSLSRSADRISNLYYVQPQVPGLNSEGFRSRHQPLADAAPLSPSSLRRFGIRMKKVNDSYFAEFSTADDSARATLRERLLWSWHRMEPLFRRGSIDLTARPDLQVGRRVTVEGIRRDRPFEFYCVATTHTLTLGDQAVRMATQIQVERGWPV